MKKIGSEVLEDKSFKCVDGRTDDGRTGDGGEVITIAHLEPSARVRTNQREVTQKLRESNLKNTFIDAVFYGYVSHIFIYPQESGIRSLDVGLVGCSIYIVA